MELTFFKPNKSNSGFLFKFAVAEDTRKKLADLFIYVNVVKQYSWDEKSGQGSFKKNFDNPDKNISIKLNLNEAADIISTIDRIKSFVPISPKFVDATIKNQKCNFYRCSFFHTWSDDQTIINVSASGYQQGATSPFPDGIFLSIVKNGSQKYFMKLSFGEAEQLKSLFNWALQTNLSRKRQLLKNMPNSNVKNDLNSGGILASERARPSVDSEPSAEAVSVEVVDGDENPFI